MELRHLRYFVAVAEEGSVTVAASRRLHTAQPSLSRQIRDLEAEVGVPLFTRNARGIEVTPAGRAFLKHAKLALEQAAAAAEAARQAARPPKQSLGLGFLTGQEMIWLPAVMSILKHELPAVDVRVTSDTSPVLADDLVRGRIDLAFMRAEIGRPELEYRIVATEALAAIVPSDHRLAAREAIGIEDLAGETLIGMSKTAPALQVVIDEYLKRAGVSLHRDFEIDNLGMAMSLVASTRSVTLLPAYAENFLPWSVVSRPLKGEPPTIDLVIGYLRHNSSPQLQAILARVDDLIERRRPTPR